MISSTVIGLTVGIAIGLFLSIGSAYILKKTLAMMEQDDASWSMGQAAGLGSLWMSKVLAAGVAIYYSQKMGVSTLYMGVGLPVGILLGVAVTKGFSKDIKK